MTGDRFLSYYLCCFRNVTPAGGIARAPEIMLDAVLEYPNVGVDDVGILGALLHVVGQGNGAAVLLGNLLAGDNIGVCDKLHPPSPPPGGVDTLLIN